MNISGRLAQRLELSPYKRTMMGSTPTATTLEQTISAVARDKLLRPFAS